LADGELPLKRVLDLAKGAGMSEDTLKRAKREVGMVSEKRGERWFWKLP
jgi:hypothetical protein